MVITTTAVAFILLSIGLALCGWRFLYTFKTINTPERKSKTGFFLSLCFVLSSLQNALLGFGMLFFANNPLLLFVTEIISHLVLSALAVACVYTAYYIFLPRSSPYFAIITAITLGVIGIISAIKNPSLPFLTLEKSIDLNMNFLFAIVTFLLLLISLGVFFYIFVKIFQKAKNREVKALSFIISASALIGTINNFIYLLLPSSTFAATRVSTFNIGIGLIGAIFVFMFVIFPLFKDLVQKKQTHSLTNLAD